MAEAKYDEETPIRKNIMENLTNTIGRSFQKSQIYQDLIQYENAEISRKLIHRTLKKRNKLPKEMKDLIEKSDSIQNYQSWLSTRSSTLEKLHFIIGHGILRAELRDEIYCQICKQLTNNPSDNSYARGWILLSLCLGCFAPTPMFEKYLKAFIRDGPDLYAPYCEERLRRTISNGTRKQPPSWIELQAVKVKSTINAQVHLMDGSQENLNLDSASTSEEICVQISKSINLKDLLGFSLFISIFDKVLPLGCERDHVMDAISKCEQYCKELGIKEKYADWKLFFQKEMFSPWHNPADDSVATNLIFNQIINGLQSGDYVCNSEKDLAMVAALQYYAEYGTHYNAGILQENIGKYLPKALCRKETTGKWLKLIELAYSKCRCNRDKLDQLIAKEDIVLYAKLTWGLKFSRFFEVVRIEEDNTALELDNSMILAINWTGVYLIDNQEQILVNILIIPKLHSNKNIINQVELSFPEIQNVYHDFDYDSVDIGVLSIQTITDEYFKLKSFDSHISYKLLNFLLMQLKKKSIYVVALHNVKKSTETDEPYLEIGKGDLITLEKGNCGENLMNSNSTWAFGSCNNQSGYFPIDMVYMLPCISPPKPEILQLFKVDY
jgi:myosin-7